MMTPAMYWPASSGPIQGEKTCRKKSQPKKRHRERLDQPVDEEGHEEAARPAADAPDRPEVDLEHHRVDHQPDEDGDRDVDVRAFAELEARGARRSGRGTPFRGEARRPCSPRPRARGNARSLPFASRTPGASPSRRSSARAAGRRSLPGVLEVLEDRVDLPAVAVGVGQPELVLERVAAGLALLLLGDDAARLQIASPAADLVGGLDPDAQVGERSFRRAPVQARAGARDGSPDPRRRTSRSRP